VLVFIVDSLYIDLLLAWSSKQSFYITVGYVETIINGLICGTILEDSEHHYKTIIIYRMK